MKHSGTKKLSDIFMVIFLCLGSAIMLYPFIYMILSSFKENQEIIRIPPTFLPEKPTFEHYQLVLGEKNFGLFFWNSLWLTIVRTSIVLYSGAFFGYVFSKLRFRGKEALFLFILATMMVPWPVTIVPQYQMMSWFGWVGKYSSIIIPSLFSTFSIYMMRQFIDAIPNELIEAGVVDGAGQFSVLRFILLPTLTAAISALGIFQFLWAWDDYLWPFLMLQNMKMYTLPVGLSLFNGQYFNDNGGIFAASSVAVLPVMIVYLMFQNQLTEGIAATGIKG